MVRQNKIKIKLNSKFINIDKGAKLSNLVKKYKFQLNKIAIEKNNLIVEKKKIKKIYLKANDKMEIVHFIGGG